MTTRTHAALVALALAVVVVLVTVLGVPFGNDDDQPDQGTAVVTQPLAPAAIADPAQPDTIAVPAQDFEQAADALDDHRDARDEQPVGVPPDDLAAATEQRQRFAHLDQLPETAPLAAPAQDGCRSTFVRNYSSRGGVAPKLIVIHYTVSPNRAGWSDINSVISWFNSSRSQASSNYIVDADANCAYIVRESDKAWTQATHNPWSISFEIINSGKEPQLTSAAGLRRLGHVISDSAERWDIPLRRGAVSGCTVTRTGIVDHAQLGICGGNHHDIRPYALQPVIAAASAHRRGASSPGTAADRVLCRKLQWARGQSPRSAAVRRNAINRRQALERRGLKCTTSGDLQHLPIRAIDRERCRKLEWSRRQNRPRSRAVMANAVERREALAARGLRCATGGKLSRA